MKTPRTVHLVQILIRHAVGQEVGFLVMPDGDLPSIKGQPPLTLPTKKTVDEPQAAFKRGESLEAFLDIALHDRLKVPIEDFVLEHELEPVEVGKYSRSKQAQANYIIYPVVVWMKPEAREALRARVNGQWLTCAQAAENLKLYVTARAVFAQLLKREEEIRRENAAPPPPPKQIQPKKPEPRPLILAESPARPNMDALAKKWFSQNKSGCRYLSRETLDAILDSGDRAFNLRVADPYLRYQMQGVGFTWSFFTHKDKQDVHVHGAPVVEIYGVLEGRMEIWWKPYYDRGTSAWSHQILGPGDWVELDSLQCHIVHWIGEGKGVVIKAGPGPLTGVGRLGVEGKTKCDDCPCMKPDEVCALVGQTK